MRTLRTEAAFECSGQRARTDGSSRAALILLQVDKTEVETLLSAEHHTIKKYLRPCKKEEDTFFNQYIFAGPNKIVMSCSTLLYFYHSLNLTLISDQYTHFSSAQCLAQLLYAALCEVPYIPMDFLHIGNLPQNIFLSFSWCCHS